MMNLGLKSSTIEDNSMKEILLNRMTETRSHEPQQYMMALKMLTIDCPCTWTHIKYDPPIGSEMAKRWIKDNGVWDHSSSDEPWDHEMLGMAFAGKGIVKNIELRDAPDFIGNIGQSTVVGDIGKCSSMSMFRGIRMLRYAGDTWISVLNWQEEIMVEFMYDPAGFIEETLSQHRIKQRRT